MLIAKPCVTMKGLVIQAYSWEKKIRINLAEVKRCLENRSIKIETFIPDMMLIALIDGFETSIYPSGKIIIKELGNTERGKEIAAIILECAGLSDLL